VSCSAPAAQALGGRLRPGADLRKGGKVRYNGLSTDEFCVERAIGLVDQYDDRELPALWANNGPIVSWSSCTPVPSGVSWDGLLSIHGSCCTDLPTLTVREMLEFARCAVGRAIHRLLEESSCFLRARVGCPRQPAECEAS
jgi:hypothetical protein